MRYVGIDIGSTASKVAVMNETKRELVCAHVMPSGWNSKETAGEILTWLDTVTDPSARRIVATGYGRVSVPYADRTVTEITCHGKGAAFLADGDLTVIDIGGQDTKVIVLEGGMVQDFIMNDKCSAGTGKFLEIMANRLGLSLTEMFDYAARGREITISAMCTVFAESEIISLMSEGASREDIAAGVIRSIVTKVVSLVSRKPKATRYYLTGGFCESDYMLEALSEQLEAPVTSSPEARYAGAIGAALLAR